MEETVPVSQSSSILGWQRAGLAFVFFADAILSLWAGGVHRFEWLPMTCFGLFWLIFSDRVKREKGEPFLAFLRKPQSIFAYTLLIVGIVGLGYNMYLMYLKHFG